MELKLIYLFLSIIGSFILNRIFYQFAIKISKTQQEDSANIPNNALPQRERWENHAKPLIGGIVFFLIFLFCSLLHNLFVPLSDSTRLSFIAPLAAGTMGFLIGFADDAFNTPPLLKFLSQLSCGLVLISLGMGIHLFDILWLDILLTLFWVVGIMNSVNMLDNMDGVTGSVSVVIITLIFFVARSAGHGEDLNSYAMVGLVGAIIGFLILNWKPSKIYMGDAGSQFLGAVLSAWGIKYLWNYDQISLMQLSNWQPLFLVVFIFIVPIMDTTFVTVARILRGQSPAIGGRDHTTHHLAYLGIPVTFIPVIFIGLTMISGYIGFYAIRKIEMWNSFIHLPLLLLFLISIFGGMLFLYQKGAKKQKEYLVTNQFSMPNESIVESLPHESLPQFNSK